ncbi:MAG: DUF721 domain-containing protein [Actinobacteria bacterium]|nr:DUF721 domain-containing protein [Actinomycetota bacterium]
MSPEENISSIIKQYLSDSNIGKKLKRYSVFNHWAEIVGSEISSKTKPEKLFKGILYISVENSAWANEISLMSRKLVKEINKFIGEDIVRELRFKIQE